MLTPSIETVTKADLEAMSGVAVEGQCLEFKEDIPVHATRVKEVAKSGAGRAKDTWWTGCKSVGDHGRNEILEELVAFANSRGGRLILGLAEGEGERPIASGLRPLPQVAALETRFRAFVLEHLEPRLVSVTVRGVETEADGSGVLILETEASHLAPHWVKPTRRPTIRRDDRCATMSMQEVQQLTLRNAERLTAVRNDLKVHVEGLKGNFQAFLEVRIPDTFMAPTREQAVGAWLRVKGKGAFAFRMALAAQDELGVPRLESFIDMVPPRTCVGVPGTVGISEDMTALWPVGGTESRILGGVRYEMAWNDGVIEYVVHRDGKLQVTCFMLGADAQALPLPRPMLVGAVGCAFGIYDRLRARSGRRHVPVDVAVAICTKGRVHVANGNGQLAELTGGQLPAWSPFPIRTATDHDDFSKVLTATAQDMADAANSGVGGPKRFVYFSSSAG